MQSRQRHLLPLVGDALLGVWKERYGRVFEDKSRSVQDVVESVHYSSDDFGGCGELGEARSCRRKALIQPQWTASPATCVKINTNASYKQGGSGVGAIAREDVSMVVKDATVPIKAILYLKMLNSSKFCLGKSWQRGMAFLPSCQRVIVLMQLRICLLVLLIFLSCNVGQLLP